MKDESTGLSIATLHPGNPFDPRRKYCDQLVRFIEQLSQGRSVHYVCFYQKLHPVSAFLQLLNTDAKFGYHLGIAASTAPLAVIRTH